MGVPAGAAAFTGESAELNWVEVGAATMQAARVKVERKAESISRFIEPASIVAVEMRSRYRSDQSV